MQKKEKKPIINLYNKHQKEKNLKFFYNSTSKTLGTSHLNSTSFLPK